MAYSMEDRAQILFEALPYIQKFNRKTIVVKYGGNAMISAELRQAVISDIVLLKLVGINVVVVHGGGPEISDMLKKIGKESRFVNGLRYTDAETMDIVQMILCGKVNKDLVSMVEALSGRAMGLCGMDGNLIQAKKLDEGGLDYGLVGEIMDVDPQPIQDAIDAGYIPVVSTVAAGIDGNKCYNINADTAAARIAASMQAEKLLILTDIPGLLRDVKDESTLISSLRVSEVPVLVKAGVISGGMIPKIDCCVEAVRSGVSGAHILDGRKKHSILIELLTDSGVGTMIY
ncbi:MAG: acetylglutamate kinase [Oscillospiraceae bacterium]|nr:acetylglutamate kinase [Oscillospiraceae bacterium]